MACQCCVDQCALSWLANALTSVPCCEWSRLTMRCLAVNGNNHTRLHALQVRGWPSVRVCVLRRFFWFTRPFEWPDLPSLKCSTDHCDCPRFVLPVPCCGTDVGFSLLAQPVPCCGTDMGFSLLAKSRLSHQFFCDIATP